MIICNQLQHFKDLYGRIANLSSYRLWWTEETCFSKPQMYLCSRKMSYLGPGLVTVSHACIPACNKINLITLHRAMRKNVATHISPLGTSLSAGCYSNPSESKTSLNSKSPVEVKCEFWNIIQFLHLHSNNNVLIDAAVAWHHYLWSHHLNVARSCWSRRFNGIDKFATSRSVWMWHLLSRYSSLTLPRGKNGSPNETAYNRGCFSTWLYDSISNWDFVVWRLHSW